MTFPADGDPLHETYTVQVNGDTTNETNETFNVNLSSPTNLTIADTQGVGTITDDDTLTWSVNDVSVNEGGLATFTVSLNRASATGQSVNFATSDGSANAGSDYTANTGTLTIPAGSTSGSINVQTTADTIDEVNETFNLTLSGQTEGNLGDPLGIGTIIDDDGPSLSIADAAPVLEGNSGTTNATFTVTRSGAEPADRERDLHHLRRDSHRPSDYAATTGTVTFAPGDPATKTVTVPVNGDTVDETNENFHVTLSSPVNSTISGGPATGTITDDDGPAISIANVTVPEGDSGTTMQNVTVSLSAPSPQDVTMDVSSADLTAIAGQDYVAIPSGTTLTIPAGQTSGTVQVGIIGDIQDEANETFIVNLSNAVNATFADNQGVVTIDDDDGVGGAGSQFSINDATVTEGNSGTTAMTFTVTRTLPNASAATVDYATAGATATSGVDFTAQSGTLSFPLGTASQQVTINVIGDRLDRAGRDALREPVEPDERDAAGRGRPRHDQRTTTTRRLLPRRARRRTRTWRCRSPSPRPTRTVTRSRTRSSPGPRTGR